MNKITIAHKKKLSLIRAILTLVSAREHHYGEYSYWGHDTEMDADDKEAEAMNKLNCFIKELDPLDEIFTTDDVNVATGEGGEKC